MSADAVDWLVQEVEDLLDAGDVGLYEFVWLQRGKDPDTPDHEHLRVAAQALDRILKAGGAQLVWLRWPQSEPVDGPNVTRPGPRDWDDPGDDPYLAITTAAAQ